jgi:hypothetical protein
MTFSDKRGYGRLATGVLLGLGLTLTGGCGGSGAAGPTSQGPTSATPAGTATPGTPSGGGSSATPVPIESNPPGDIPDNLAFVTYSNTAGRYSLTYPEGWARSGSGTMIRFIDKLNGIAVDSLSAANAPTVAQARAVEVPRLSAAVPAFELRSVAAITLPGGSGVLIVFRRNSDPDPVTGKVYRDEVQEYLIYRSGRLVRLDLFGPVGADNVDAYRTMSQSVRIR